MNRTTPGSEFLIGLDRGGVQPMHFQIEQAIRRAIRDGRLRPGAAMPSTRTLSGDLGVSRGVAVVAYDQLIAEGYLMARTGAATRVADSIRTATVEPPKPEHQAFEFDFRPGHPDLKSFPREAWRSASRKALRRLAPGQLGYGDPRGAQELRSALAEYLARARGVVGSPGQIIVCTGCAQGLSIAARVLRNEGIKRIAVEDPGHPEIRNIILEAGVVPVPVTVDDDGLNVEALERTRLRAVILSPAHQNPMGSVLTPARRHQLLAWASRTSAFLVEDDYDAEYRYDRAGIGALQGLAPERVFYVGSASKILAPALRLGWLLIGGTLHERAIDIKRRLDNGSPVIEQLALAEFLESGELDRHLSRMRRLYRARREALLQALARHCPDWTVRGAAAGLHLVAQPPNHVDIGRLVRRAAAGSVRLYPLQEYAGNGRRRRGLVFGYARLSEVEVEEAVRRMSEAVPR